MSNLAQYRLSIALFSFGLLWAASEVVGDSDKPGPLAAATKTIVHRLKPTEGNADGRAHSPYDLAVSETDFGDRDAREPTGATTDDASASIAASNDGTADIIAPSAQAEPAAAAELPPPDVGMIHK